MKTKFKRRRPALWRGRITPRWPLVVWLLAVLVSIWLYRRGVDVVATMGVVDRPEESIAPMELGMVASIEVEMGDSVTNGQIVAYMDTSIIDAEIAIEEALRLEESETITGYQQNILGLVSRLVAAQAMAEATVLAEERGYAQAQAREKVLAAEVERLKELYKQRLVTASEVSVVVAEHAGLERAVELYPQAIDVLKTRLREAEEDVEKLCALLDVADKGDIFDAVDAKLSARRDIRESQIALLQERKRQSVLRAHTDGVVSAVVPQPGDVVPEGMMIISVVAETSDRVIGFLPEIDAREMTAGMRVSVRRRHSHTSASYNATVVTLIPEIVTLPGRVSPVRNQQMRGRRVVVRIDDKEHTLLPGETVDISVPKPVLPKWIRDMFPGGSEGELSDSGAGTE